ncbi:hypothetical protein V8C42DRAFT_343080 [Trichoderma barbatum]
MRQFTSPSTNAFTTSCFSWRKRETLVQQQGTISAIDSRDHWRNAMLFPIIKMDTVTLHNNTTDTFNFTGNKTYLHNPPQEINPGDSAVIQYTPGEPSVMWYMNTEGQIVVEVGNSSQGNKLWGEGAYTLQTDGWKPNEFKIVRA